MRRGRWREAVATSAFWLMVLDMTQTLGCGCGAPQDRRGPPTFLSGQPATSAPTAAALSAAAVAAEPQDPRDMKPVLDDVRLAAVRAALRAGERPAAAQALRAALAQHRPQGEERSRWTFVLGRILADAGDPAGAAVAFDDAATATTWILRDYALMGAAEAYAAVGKHDEAATRAGAVGPDVPIAEGARLARADALDAMGSKEEAVQIWHEHLAAHPTGTRWAEGAVRVAQALLEGAADTNRAVDALHLVRRVLSEAPTAKSAREAKELEAAALGRLSVEDRRKYEDWPVELQLLRAQSLADRGQRTRALDALEDLVESLSAEQRQGSVGCSATYLQAKLLESDRKKRAASADMYAEAVRRCERHKGDLINALYAGAKMNARVGRPKQALTMFERVEKEFATHRFADDARLRGAKVALLMRNEPKFEKMLSTMAGDYPDGDMVEDGLFELAFHHIGKGAWDKAIAPLEKSVEARPREKKYWEAGRARYFLARAHEVTGKPDLAKENYEQVVLEHPLSYYMALAYGRLRARAPDAAAEAMKRGETSVPPAPAPGPLPKKLSGPAFERAVELLRIGDVDAGRTEIRELGLQSSDGDALWIVASLYARGGDERLAHQVARTRSEEWCTSYPQGRWREAWRLAYPQMYPEIVQRETEAAGIPVPLAYGIMREESAFDADVVSWADAYGLMQLIMPTARGVAGKLKMKVDEQSLIRPEVNIKLGCTLLGSLRGMFPTAPVMAIPSYNAGAGATKRWLGSRTSDDFDLWVENITYDETRGYTKRVLSTMAVYAYLYYPNELASALQLPEQLDL